MLRLALEFVMIDGASKGIRGVSDELAKAGKEGQAAAKMINAGLDDVSAGLKKLSIARELKTQLIDPLVDAASQVEGVLKQIEVNLPSNMANKGEVLKQMSTSAAATAATTPFDTTQILQADLEFLKSGLSVLEAQAASDVAAKLATAEGVSPETAQSAMVVGSSMFGSKDYAAIGDMLVKAASAGANVGVTDIKEAMGSLTQAGSFGLNMNETGALFGAMGAVNMKGTEAGNAADSFLTTLATKGKKAKLNVFDEQGQFKGWAATQEALKERTAGMTDQKRAKYLADVFGVGPAMAMAQALLNKNVDVAATQAQMTAALGLDPKNAAMQTTFGGRVEALGGSLETLRAQLGAPLLDPLGQLAAKANDLVGVVGARLDGDPELQKRLGLGLGAGVAGLGIIGALQTLKGGAGMLGGLAKAAGVGGVVKGKVQEKVAGVTPVYVTNVAEFGGALGGAGGAPAIPGLPAPAAGAPTSKAARLAAGVSTVGAAAAIGGAANEGGIGIAAQLADSKNIFGQYLAFSMATAAKVSPSRLFTSDEGIASASATQEKAWAGLKESLGLKVEVKVDKSGNADVDARWADTGATARARAGAP